MSSGPDPVLTIPKAAQEAMRLLLTPEHNSEKVRPAKVCLAKVRLKKVRPAIRRQIEGDKLIRGVCHQVMRRKLFGPRMQSTQKHRLMSWSSFAAIRQAQAADEWKDRMDAAAGN